VSARVDILVLSLGTTRGLRIADAELVEMMRQAGASVTAAGTRIGARPTGSGADTRSTTSSRRSPPGGRSTRPSPATGRGR
jgi:hypothetical protein